MDPPPFRSRTVEPDPDDKLLDFDCPRCGEPTSGRFYSPCPGCVEVLRSSLSRDPEPMAAPEYEPKMNVNPNAVATRDQ